MRLEELGHIPEVAFFGAIDVVGLYPHIPYEESLESMRLVLSEFKEIVTVSEWHVDGVWWRFLDDIFFIWLHGIERLQEFLKFIDSFHETISYTWDYSENQVSFLHVTICREVGGVYISTDVFSKPTDTHQYLDYRSSHPRHVRQAIPYGQALRLRRICSSERKFDQRIEEFKGYLNKRGFQKTQISSQCEKVRTEDRKLLLFQDKERFVDSKVPLVLNSILHCRG